jgi:hypothetical protein
VLAAQPVPNFPRLRALALFGRRSVEQLNVTGKRPHLAVVRVARKPNGDVDAAPWCQGFHAAMHPRLKAWAPLLDSSNINHGLLSPILLHCVDDEGRPLLGPARKGRDTAEFLRGDIDDGVHVVELADGNDRRKQGPIFGPDLATGEERIFSGQADRPERARISMPRCVLIYDLIEQTREVMERCCSTFQIGDVRFR